MQIGLVGLPGVGKGLLLMLYSFWKSFHEKKNVVLVCCIRGEGGGLFIFLLQGQNHPSDDNNNNNNKEMDAQRAPQAAEALPTLLGQSDFSQMQPKIANTQQTMDQEDAQNVHDKDKDDGKLQKWSVGTFENLPDVLLSIGQRIGNYELCLDGINQNELFPGRLEAFSVLATSAQFEVKSADTPVLERCLVPFWSFSDLKTVGNQNQWNEDKIKQVIIILEAICDCSYWAKRRLRTQWILHFKGLILQMQYC